MIVCWAKNFNCSVDYVLYEMSWQNLILYTLATPGYDDEVEDDGVKDIDWDRFDASDPDNNLFNNLPEYAR